MLLPKFDSMDERGESPLLSSFKRTDGTFHSAAALRSRRSREDLFDEDESLLQDILLHSSEQDKVKMKRPFMKRSKRSMNLWAQGRKRPAVPQVSLWWNLYFTEPDLQSKKFHTNFRNRFRMPYEQYLDFHSQSRQESWFPRWMKSNSNAPIELLLLGALRYLVRWWTFDDLEEKTCISVEVHRNFFYAFIDVGEKILYPQFVRHPISEEEVKVPMAEYLAGFDGAIGSTVATHIVIEKCSYR